MILEKIDGEQQRVHVLVHPDRSTLPYRVGFPVFVSNLVQLALRRAQLSEVQAAGTGVLPALAMPADTTVNIAGPAGYSRSEKSGSDGRLSGVSAPRVGVYTVSGSGEPIAVGASLLSAAESALGGVEQIEFAEQLKVSATSAAPRVDRSLWWPLSCIALVVLLAEWWWFNRRQIAARA
jgi:hypothetical protein